ncbi:melanophilin isoform X2 [Agelaius phoeniceus]|uniref:melanophilin isoform X2 n=1 Tax=Agelaius phoeniceus TaxID=39638 RepID=UPI004054B0AD
MEPVLPGVQARLLPGMLRSLPKPVACLPRGGSLSFAHPASGRQRVNISRSPSQAGEVCSSGQDPGGRQGGPAGVPAAIGAVPALLGGQARPAERLRCWQEPAGLPAALPLPAYMGSRGGGAELSLPLRQQQQQQHPGTVRDSERSGGASNGIGFVEGHRGEMGRKLDLSKLTDEEAKHVWEVVQRDFDLRKKEEERLEELKCKIDQESSKREFLTSQSHLNETHCVHCLQPFKFLLNSKRQCLDCHFYTCKNCSRYHKKEQGWVCDPCRLSRIVKIGSLEWYYEHVRSRFKRFGSAKVLQSLYGRLQPGQGLNSAFLGLHDRVYSLPDINRECQLLSSCDPGDDSDEEDNVLRGAEAERYSRMCKTKRLLSVHPFDFELDSDYSAQSRRQSVQLSPAASSPDAFQSFPDFPTSAEDVSQESRIRDADLVFHHVLQEPGASAPEQHFSTEVRLTVNARRRRSLERNPKPGTPWNEPPRARYSADMDTSDEELRGAQLPAQPSKRRSRASSQENISHSSNQIHELNTRMSAIERVLNRLEEKILTRPDESLAPESHTDPDAEEEELKRKLEELASNISDKEVSSDEEEREEEKRAKKPEMSSSSEAMTRDVRKVYLAAGKTYQLEKTLKELEEGAQHSGTTDSELSELEDKVASAAARVQQAESEISDIESRIAALSAAGLTVKSVEKAKKAKSSVQAACLHSPAPASSSPGESLDDIKAMPGLQRFRRKFNSPLEITSFDDSFDRNSAYRGSLTQRNPNGKNRRVERLFAKPVMTHLS